MNRWILPSSVLAIFVFTVMGILQAEAYDEGLTITELKLYKDIGKDSFAVGGIIGPHDAVPTGQVKITIFDKNKEELVFEGHATIDDSQYFLPDNDSKEKFWAFSLNSSTLEGWSSNGVYSIMAQFDGKSDEMHYQFEDFEAERVVLNENTHDEYHAVQTKAVSGMPKDNDSTGYVKAGSVITMNEHVSNPHNYEVSASIEYVFENINGNNHLENKKHVGVASANGSYGVSQKYVMQNPGKFNIHMVYSIDGKITEDPNPREFVVVERYSDAAANGCSPDHEIIVKSDYSQTVCVFPESVKKLVQRGWVSD